MHSEILLPKNDRLLLEEIKKFDPVLFPKFKIGITYYDHIYRVVYCQDEQELFYLERFLHNSSYFRKIRGIKTQEFNAIYEILD